ncbi:MAG: hypothetical protein AAF624_13750 [Bacteroidota bacterium]
MPRLAVAACLVLALVAATAMTRPADATHAAETAALTTEAHALVADMQAAATSQTDHPLALLDAPETFQALTIYRDHGSFRLTAYGLGEGLLTFTDTAGTERLQVRFDRTTVLATEALV